VDHLHIKKIHLVCFVYVVIEDTYKDASADVVDRFITLCGKDPKY
jgi:hypothetical protein